MSGDPVFLRHERLDDVPHGFFTRIGGVSVGPYNSLNCSMRSGDVPDALRENRRRVAAAFGHDPERLLGVTQVHGSAVMVAEAPWAVGGGPEADAMVTRQPGLLLGVITADCAPVLFADPAAGVVGAAHAGWRGAAAGILERTVDAMRALGAARIEAVVGPCIAQESYEVGPELRAAVRAAGRVPEPDAFFRPGSGDRLFFDLAAYCVARLASHGTTAAAMNRDTLADETHFFSHRRRTLGNGGPIGHQISVIGLRSGTSAI